MTARSIVLIYAVVAAAWIVASDVSANLWPVTQAHSLAVSITKGLAFILVTASLLYWLMRRRDRQLRRSESRAAGREQHLALAIEGSDGGAWSFAIDPDKPDQLPDDASLSPRLKAFLGYEGHEFPNSRSAWRELVHEDDLVTLDARMHAHFTGQAPYHEGEYRIRHKDRSMRWLYSRGQIFRDAHGRPVRWAGIDWDITQTKDSQSWLAFTARHDALTGCPNRAFLAEKMEQAMQEASRRGLHAALLVVDIHRLKAVNDSYGRAIADECLKLFAERIRNTFSEPELFARLHGDEFALLLPLLPAPEAAGSYAERLLKLLEDPFRVNEHAIHLGINIGIAVSPNDGTTADGLMEAADHAVRESQTTGRMRYQFYTTELHASVELQVAMERQLEHAFRRNEFVLHYQPTVSAVTGEVSGFEALVRWHHPRRGLLSPGQFLPVIADGGYTLALGDYVVREACGQLRSWVESHDLRVPVAINVAGPQMLEGSVVSTLRELLAESAFPANLLEIEITETFILHDIEAAILSIQQLRELGVSVTLDDFGTGYSSLSYLAQLPISRIKIDRSFVRDLPNTPRTAAVIQAVLSLGRHLRLRTTAEGVETAEQLRFLHELGCSEYQGFLFSRPLPSGEVPPLFKQRFENVASLPRREPGRDRQSC